jgi:hypothetical protein
VDEGAIERRGVRSAESVVDDPDYPPTPHLERLYVELKSRLDVQRYELDDLQRILAIVLAASGVVLGFAGSQLPRHSVHDEIELLIAAVVALTLAVVAGATALWPRAVKAVPEPTPLAEEYIDQATNVMLYDLIGSARTAYEENEAMGIRLRRSRLVRLQLLLLGLGAALLGTGVLVPHL